MKSIFNKLNISDIGMGKIKKIPWILGSNAFSIILIFILLDLILGEFLLYKYVIIVKREGPEIVQSTLKFEYNIYQKVLEEWQTRERKFEDFTVKIYSNPFITEPKNSLDL
mgnify:CR=1 FL=1